MNNDIDLLQIKIERAKESLPKDVLSSINSVDWKTVIATMKDKNKYSISQLEDLELETELLLCGLISPEKYHDEVKKRMGISEMETQTLINEMNERVFKRIREDYIQRTSRMNPEPKTEKIPEKVGFVEKEKNTESVKKLDVHPENEPQKEQNQNSEKIEHALASKILTQTFKIESKNTDHSIGNTQKQQPKINPYREIPE